MVDLNYGEIIALILGVFVMLAIVARLDQVSRLDGWRWLVAAYCCLLAGGLLTVSEALAFGAQQNVIEHLCYTASVILVTCWIWRRPSEGRGAL